MSNKIDEAVDRGMKMFIIPDKARDHIAIITFIVMLILFLSTNSILASGAPRLFMDWSQDKNFYFNESQMNQTIDIVDKNDNTHILKLERVNGEIEFTSDSLKAAIMYGSFRGQPADYKIDKILFDSEDGSFTVNAILSMPFYQIEEAIQDFDFQFLSEHTMEKEKRTEAGTKDEIVKFSVSFDLFSIFNGSINDATYTGIVRETSEAAEEEKGGICGNGAAMAVIASLSVISLKRNNLMRLQTQREYRVNENIK